MRFIVKMLAANCPSLRPLEGYFHGCAPPADKDGDRFGPVEGKILYDGKVLMAH
jgi:hypothetical protein